MTRKSMKVVVTVNNRQWRAVSSFRDAGPNDAVFTLNQGTGNIAFGNGVNGAKPPVGSVITVRYHYGSGSAGNISKRIDDESQLSKFWVVVRDSEQSVGWGCVKTPFRDFSAGRLPSDIRSSL
jgi:hypothetical protein